jgi:DNA-binding transcriptional LysR family regulator
MDSVSQERALLEGHISVGWLLKACRRAGFKPRIVKKADGAASALAFVAAGFGVALVGEPLQKILARDVIFAI